MKPISFWNALQQPVIGLAPMDDVTDTPCRTMHGLYSKPDLVMTEFTNGEKISSTREFFYDIPPFFPSSHHFGVNIVPFILYDKVIINKTWFGRTREAKDELLLNPIFESR